MLHIQAQIQDVLGEQVLVGEVANVTKMKDNQALHPFW